MSAGKPLFYDVSFIIIISGGNGCLKKGGVAEVDRSQCQSRRRKGPGRRIEDGNFSRIRNYVLPELSVFFPTFYKSGRQPMRRLLPFFVNYCFMPLFFEEHKMFDKPKEDVAIFSYHGLNLREVRNHFFRTNFSFRGNASKKIAALSLQFFNHKINLFCCPS